MTNLTAFGSPKKTLLQTVGPQNNQNTNTTQAKEIIKSEKKSQNMPRVTFFELVFDWLRTILKENPRNTAVWTTLQCKQNKLDEDKLGETSSTPQTMKTSKNAKQ